MLLGKFFQTIRKEIIGGSINERTAVLSGIDPGIFYIENIRRLHNITFNEAKEICDQAVSEHLFSARIGVKCPKCGRIIKSFANEEEIPKEITCNTCEIMEEPIFSYKKEDCKTIEFFTMENNIDG